MIRGLVKIANKLDSSGLVKEADILDSIIRKVANDPDFDDIDSDFFSEEENERYFKDNDLRFSEEGDESFFDDYDYENSPEGIGTTEPIYDGKTPEEKLLAKLEALEIIDGKETDNFKSFVKSLSKEQWEAFIKMFGENSITPSYRVKNYSYEER